MSETLNKLMMLQRMNVPQQQHAPMPMPNFGMNPIQSRQAQGDALMRVGQEISNPRHKGKGINRMLAALAAGVGPAYDAYRQREQEIKQENMSMYKLQKEEEKEAKREERELAKIARDEAYNQRYLDIMEGKGKQKTNPEAKERRILWNALGNDAKAEEYRKGMILNWSPTETQANFLQGIHPEDAAREKGINLSEHEGSYLLTGAGRDRIKSAEGIEAEIASLTEDTAEDLGYFGPEIPGFGFSANEMFDSLTGKNKEKRLRGLGARAVQAEINGARSRFAGASSAQEAIHGMQKDALAKVGIFAPGISGTDRVFVQRYINEKLEKAFKARKRASMGLSRHKDQDKNADAQESQDLSRMVRIVDEDTGEERVVTLEEAMEMGATQ
jgi:hypothetical protein